MRSISTTRQAGFGHIITIALVVVAFSAVGYIGYKLYAHPMSKTSQSYSQPAPAQLNVPAAPAIKTAQDFDKAQGVLDQVDPSTTNQGDLSQLDSQLNSF